jgi:ketosteroid isomerase-like protein
MRSWYRWYPGVLLAGISLSPLAAQGHGAALLEAERLAAELSSDSGLPAAMNRSLDGSGILLWPGAPVLAGTADVRKFFASDSETALLRLTWQPLGLELSRDSALGVTWGVVATAQGSSSAERRFGRYISVWQKDADHWRLAAIVFIGVGTAETAVPPGLPLSRAAAPSSGKTARFVTADLEFARVTGARGAAAAFRAWAADDAVMFGRGGLLIRGSEAIGRAVEGAERWRWHPVAAGAAASGDLGWTVGEAVITGKEGQPSYSKYLTVWRHRGGTTRFLLDGGNARPATP